MVENIQRVHLVFKTHLDVGFTDFARKVTQSYFEQYIPAAIELSQRLRAEGKEERFLWTTGSWLIYEYLEKATPAQKKLLEDAIVAGDIVWHGLPFTTHTELMDVELFKYGLSLSQALDKRFGRKTIAAKMTDVPGHTRGIVPLLAEAGIQFLHLGANQASTPPDVPPVFRWQSAGSEIMVMYQKGGYGDVMTVAGLGDALAFAHTNDNHGPQTIASVLQSYKDMRERFPEAQLLASTMDAFAEKLLAIKAKFPVITAELGDTWIHGVGSDPVKVAQYRELLRLRNQWIEVGEDKKHERAFSEFSRSLMMVPEHTWGMDEKVHLKDYTHYDAKSFHAARQEKNFQTFESSWAEQRAYVTDAIKALENTPLHDEAVKQLDTIKPIQPSARGYEVVRDKEFETKHFTVGFDGQTGAIVRLKDKPTGREWAAQDHPLGLFSHETFSEDDYQRYWQHYIINKRQTRIWSLADNTKIGIGEAAPVHRTWTANQTNFYRKSDDDGDTFLLDLQVDHKASEDYGCPRILKMKITFPNDKAQVHFDLQWFEKSACRLPEAAWMSFNPQVSQPQNWQMDKLGEWISPLDVIRNGNRKLHAVESGVRWQSKGTELMVETLDAPLVAPGEPSLLNFNNRQPNLRNGMHFNLLNNVWATNFRMWYEDDSRFRFILRLGEVR